MAANFSKVQYIEVDGEYEGQRLDNYLLRLLKGVPRSHIYCLVRTDEIRVNNKRAKASQRLCAKDVIRVAPIRVAERKKGPVARGWDWLSQKIILENEVILAIDKPAGLAVHGGSGINQGLIEIVRAGRPDLKFIELVHRLDKETSGCILLAKKRSLLKELHEKLRLGEVKKHYIGLVAGSWSQSLHSVKAPLKKNLLSSGERVVKVSELGKPSLTRFKVREYFDNYTLLDIELVTGRTHQIRVHCQYAGHPIIGDEKYGDSHLNKKMRSLGSRRMYLHSSRIQLNSTYLNNLIIEAPLPESIAQPLGLL